MESLSFQTFPFLLVGNLCLHIKGISHHSLVFFLGVECNFQTDIGRMEFSASNLENLYVLGLWSKDFLRIPFQEAAF